MVQSHQLSSRPLFGGAIKCLVPTTFVDASVFRQVPDNQEVFVDQGGDNSFIVELLEAESTPVETSAQSFH